MALKIRSRKRLWCVILIAAFLLLAGFFAQDKLNSIFGKSDRRKEAKQENSELGSVWFRTANPRASTNTPSLQPEENLSRAELVADLPARSNVAVAQVSNLNSAELFVPKLKLAIADMPKIYTAYYKTRLAKADFAKSKEDKEIQKSEMLDSEKQLKAELVRIVLTYSVDHQFDLVLDSGSDIAKSGVPTIIYSRPGFNDITDDIIAVANAGHESK